MSVIVAFLFAISLWYLSSNHKVTFVKPKATFLKFLPNRSWHRLIPAGGTFVSAKGGTFQSDTPGTFVSAMRGTFDSDIPGTFESDTGGTFNPLLSYLGKDGQNVVVYVNQQEVFRIPVINIEGIVTFGYMGASPGLMRMCADNGVSLSFLSQSGHFIGRVQGQTKGNVLLRKAQYLMSDDTEASLHIAKVMVAGKIHNSRSVLRRYLRDYGENPDIESATKALDMAKYNALRAKDSAELMGVEGLAANNYFSSFHHLILQQKQDFPFEGRNRRPPKDAVNAMLSLAYTLLANDVSAALETVGLDPYVGFFHTLRPGRTSLALDVMEELRAYMGDRFVLSLINRRQLSSKEFLYQGEKGVVLNDNGRRIFLTAWQSRKKDEIVHPYLGEKIPIGLIPYVQAMLLARYVRSDIDDYPVFLYK